MILYGKVLLLILTTILTISSHQVRASFPTDTFDSYTNGDLSGNSGGSGWGANWGTTGGCNSLIDVQDTIFQSGKAAGSSANATDRNCYRDFTNITDNSSFYFYIYNVLTTHRHSIILLDSGTFSDQVELELFTNGQIRTIDNVTTTNLQAYSAATWYKITIEVKYSTEEFRIKINEGSFSAWYHMINYGTVDHTIGTGRLRWVIRGDGSTSGYLDEITGDGGSSSGETTSLNIASTSATTTLGEIGKITFNGIILFLISTLILWTYFKYIFLVKI